MVVHSPPPLHTNHHKMLISHIVLGNCHFLPQVAKGLLGLGLQCSNRNNRNVIDNDHGTTNLNHGDKEDKHKQG